jgi:hypothetical protein
MYGGIALRELAVAPLLRLSHSSSIAAPWRKNGSTPRGEIVWERSFALGQRRDALNVTVLYNPHTSTSRTLYATLLLEDEAPRIPASIRREVRAFTKRLETPETA